MPTAMPPRRALGIVDPNVGRMLGQRQRNKPPIFAPSTDNRFGSASQQVKAAAAAKEADDDDSEDEPIAVLAARHAPATKGKKSKRAARRPPPPIHEEEEEPITPTPPSQPRNQAEAALQRDAQRMNAFSPLADDEPDSDAESEPHQNRAFLGGASASAPGMSRLAWETREKLHDTMTAQFPDALAVGTGHLTRFMIKYGKNPEMIKDKNVRAALENLVSKVDPDGKLHPIDIWVQGTLGQRGLIALGWWQHNEKVQKGDGARLSWKAYKGYMNHCCSYARLYESLDGRSLEEQRRMQILYPFGWKHDKHPAFKAVRDLVQREMQEEGNVSAGGWVIEIGSAIDTHTHTHTHTSLSL